VLEDDVIPQEGEKLPRKDSDSSQEEYEHEGEEEEWWWW